MVAALVSVLSGCEDPTWPPAERPQTVVLFATPKFVSDFADPAPDVARFLEHYAPLTTRADRTVVIYGVGNSEHILLYRGRTHWDDEVAWARYTGFRENPVSERAMDYHQVAAVVRAFRERGGALGLDLALYDQIDQGREFAETAFKDWMHPECIDREYEDAFDIRGVLEPDPRPYASRPDGIAAGTACGTFLVDQVVRYLDDLGFDGILYGNQLGTRGHWRPERGPGWSDEEAAAIRDFMAYSKEALGEKELMWFDSYNHVPDERRAFSFPGEAYGNFDYLIAAGFCVISSTERYIRNLESKMALGDRTRVLATLDWVDPWYDYDSMRDYPSESAWLERIAVAYRSRIDGVVFFANDHRGALVPRPLIERFADRFFGPSGEVAAALRVGRSGTRTAAP